MYLVFEKLMGLSQYTINKAEAGKLSNMLSNDFSLMEMKISYFFGLLAGPFVYPVAIGIMIWWLGVEGLICFGVILVSFPLQIYISSEMGKRL